MIRILWIGADFCFARRRDAATRSIGVAASRRGEKPRIRGAHGVGVGMDGAGAAILALVRKRLTFNYVIFFQHIYRFFEYTLLNKKRCLSLTRLSPCKGLVKFLAL